MTRPLAPPQDGVLRGPEVSGMLTLVMTQGEPLSTEEAKEFFDELDADQDGVVSKREYMRMMQPDDGEAYDTG